MQAGPAASSEGIAAAFANELVLAHADSDCEDGEPDGLGDSSEEAMAANSPCLGCRQRPQQPQTGPGSLPHRSASHGHRLRVCQEFVGTERKYCCCLSIIIDLLAESVKAAACVSVKDLCLIFPRSLPRLRELHLAFLTRLEERLHTETAAEIGTPTATFSTVVLDFLEANDGELFRLYRDYVNDFGCAVRTLRKCQQRSSRLRRLLHCLQRHPSCEGLDLTAFLLTPVQRTPRYLLLLSQLQAHTSAGHPDMHSLSGALSSLRCLLDGLNVSIHTALRQAAPTQPQQKQKKPHSGHPHGSASCESLQLLGRLACRRDSCDVGGSGGGSGAVAAVAVSNVHHFLLGVRCRVTQPDLVIYSCDSAAAARCGSVPPPRIRAGSAVVASLRDPSPTRGLMGPRSRAISRQLQSSDRCHSAGDILRPPHYYGSNFETKNFSCASPLHPAPLATGDEEPRGGLLAPPRHGTGRRRAQSSSRAAGTLKESLRKVFLPKRKSLVSDTDCLGTTDSSRKDEEAKRPS